MIFGYTSIDAGEIIVYNYYVLSGGIVYVNKV